MNKFIFTTSWDDGSVLDMKVAHLLSRYGMRGTFYIPQKFDGSLPKFSSYDRRLNEEEIRVLSLSHEIGAHSITHRRLTDISPEEAKREIFDSKIFLEKIIGRSVNTFCFPGGKYNDEIVRMTKDAGYLEARTTRKLATRKPTSFLTDVTIICQPYPFRKLDAGHYYWSHLLDPMNIYEPKVWTLSWLSLAKKTFKKALEEGDYFHLYGHSWEIEKYDMWSELEAFLAFVKKYENITSI